MGDRPLLVINEVQETIMGEAGFLPQGFWCTLIRFQGCNLSCSYCDAPSSLNWDSKKKDYFLIVEDDDQADQKISDFVNSIKTNIVLITGGEPLMQNHDGLERLIDALTKQQKQVQIETNGSLPIPPHFLDKSVFWVVDYKCPSSGMEHHMPTPDQFISFFNSHRSIVKFVIDPEDIDWAIHHMLCLKLAGYYNPFIISPVDAAPETVRLAIPKLQKAGIIKHCIFSIQEHKILNLP